MPQDIIKFLIAFVIVGVALWLVTSFVPMPAPMPTVLVVVIVLLMLAWLARLLGVWGGPPA